MKSIQLLTNLQFRDVTPNAEPIYVDRNGRAILFTLKPGQAIKQHDVPSSPFYAIVLKGHGYFSGKDRREERLSPNDLVIFDTGEEHFVRADNEELVFIGILHGEPSNQSTKTGGRIARNHRARAQ
jgi:quercetin dioxygenase-like cupin family protein